MIARLAGLLRRRRRRVAPALEERLTALERALGAKLEAQLVVLAQALAEVVTSELARERRQLRQGAGKTTDQPARTPALGRAAKGSLLDRTAAPKAFGARS